VWRIPTHDGPESSSLTRHLPPARSPLAHADLQTFPCILNITEYHAHRSPRRHGGVANEPSDAPLPTGELADPGAIDQHSEHRHRGCARKDLSKLCKMFPNSGRLQIGASSRKMFSNNNLRVWHRVGNGPCLFQCAKDGVSSVLAGQGKRRGRATQRLRPHFPDILTGPVSSVKPHTRKRQSAYRTFSLLSERPAGPGRSLFSLRTPGHTRERIGGMPDNPYITSCRHLEYC
jgi:hypothetical protein